jgi:CHAT domain-containing protein/Flp pilus assembly protein TadD
MISLLKIRFYIMLLVLIGILSSPFEGGAAQSSELLPETQLAMLEKPEDLDQKVFELYDQRRYNEAITLSERALEIRKQLLGYDHSDVATNLITLATLYESQGQYDKAEQLYTEALSLRRRLFGERHMDVAMSISRLAGLYESKGQYDESEKLYLEALRLGESLSNDQDLNLAVIRNNLAILYDRQGRYKDSEKLYLDVLKSYRSQPVDHSISIAETLTNLASPYQKQGRYQEAEKCYLEALRIYGSLLSDGNLEVLNVRNNLALLYKFQGRYPEAEKLYVEVLAQRKSLLNNYHLDVAASLNNLAELYRSQGNYDQAEQLNLQALDMYKSILGDQHLLVAVSLSSLSLLYQNQGRYKDAESQSLKALEMRKSLLGHNHILVANSLNNLAFLYHNQGRYDEAEPLYIEALEMRKKLLPYDHEDIITSLNNLAGLYQNQGHYKDAETLYLQSSEMQKKLLGDRHPNFAASLNNLAELYRSQGRYKEAEPAYMQALKLNRSLLGDWHPNVAINLNNLSLLYNSQDDYDKATQYLAQGLAIEEKHVAINLEIGAEAQKYDYIKTVQSSIDGSISLHLQHVNNSQAAHLALTTILRRKGRILNTLTDSLQRLRKNLPASEQDILDQFFTTNTQLANLYHNQVNNLSPEYSAKLIDLEQKASQIAANLSRRSLDFRSTIQPVNLASIQSTLPSNSALVELIQYRFFNPKATLRDQWSRSRYAAYILTSSGSLTGIDLGSTVEIDQAVTIHRDNLRDPQTPILQLKQSARKLDQLLMQPIRQHLGSTRNILLSPDSTLNLLPFEALVDEQGRYLLETYNITYLTSGRDLLRFQNPKPNNNPPLILADPFFDKASPTFTSRYADLAKLAFPPLQQTNAEAQAIGTLFGSHPLLGTQATETAIKQTKSPSILHIATHGFFLPSNDSKDNPLLQSGLVFAGFKVGKSGNDDGILTALEVSNLNLAATKLVTLSACDTGLGSISSGEGIYGLRRALVVAGAESQVISLWKVADDATKELMINYYTRLKQGEGRSAALHQAQRDMLKSEKYSHPYYWAAFIPSGDWRPLGN